MHSCQKYMLIRPIVFIELMNGELHIMLVPVRCFTCGNLVAHKYAEYTARIKAGEDPADGYGFIEHKTILLSADANFEC